MTVPERAHLQLLYSQSFGSASGSNPSASYDELCGSGRSRVRHPPPDSAVRSASGDQLRLPDVHLVGGQVVEGAEARVTVMISIPSGGVRQWSLSALASGTEVAITFAPAAIAALMPATCLATSLFA